MNEHRTTLDHTATPAARLERQGFTADQIARLDALRELYPILEFVESREQLQRLRFLKWRHARQLLAGCSR